MTEHKRDYNVGGKARKKQYPINISNQEYNQLEELRHRLSERWGHDVSRGRFIMWMYRKVFYDFDGTDTVEDYCENQESEILEMMGMLQNMLEKNKRFKDGIMTEEEEDGETQTE